MESVFLGFTPADAKIHFISHNGRSPQLGMNSLPHPYTNAHLCGYHPL